MFNYKVFIAELIGTFALVFIGAAASLYDSGLLAVALAHGLTLAVFVYAFGHISGAHINPAVTFGMALNGTVEWAEAAVYWIAQFAGAVLAGFALQAIVGLVNAQAFAGAQSTGILTQRFPYFGLGVEALLAFFLVTAYLHAAVAGKAGAMGGWVIGTTLAVAILAGGPLTGASLNPARTFGPAVAAGTARDGMMYLIYFVGPLLGSAIAVGAYRLLDTPGSGPEMELMLDEDDVEEEIEEAVG